MGFASINPDIVVANAYKNIIWICTRLDLFGQATTCGNYWSADCWIISDKVWSWKEEEDHSF